MSIKILQLDNNTSKETKGIFLPPYVVLCFIVPIDIHTIKQNVHVEILVNSGVTTFFVDENFARQEYLHLVWNAMFAYEIIDGCNLASSEWPMKLNL